MIFFPPFQARKLCKFLADFVHKTSLLQHCTCVRNKHKAKTFWLVYKINAENFGGSTPKTPLQQHWHCRIVTICPFKL